MARNARKDERRRAREAAAAAATPPAGEPTAGAAGGPMPGAAPPPRRPASANAPGLVARLEALLASPAFLAGVLAVAAVLRLVHVAGMTASPYFDHLDLDPLAYDEWGQRIAAGDWLGSRIFYQDPLYPYFLGAFYSLFGRSIGLLYAVQVAFGVGTCSLVALLGRRVFGAASGNLAALLAALFVPSIFYEAQVEKTFLSVFLVAGFLVLFLGRSLGERAGAGAVLALAVLTRANLLVFLPMGALVLAFEGLLRGAAGRGRRGAWAPGPDALRQAAAFLGGAMLVLAPVLLRNHAVGGEWVVTTSQAGQNFYIGNNPLNTTGSYIVPPSIRPDTRYEETDFRAEAERATGRKLVPSEVSDYWMDLALAHIRSDPAFARMMFLRKFLLFWNDYEVPDNLNMDLMERWSGVLGLPLPGVGLLVVLAVLGAVASLGTNADARLLAGFTVVYAATVVAFFVFSRYRIQVMPVLAVLGAEGVLWTARQAEGRRWDVVAGAAAAAAMAAFFCFQKFDWVDRTRALAVSLNNLGALYSSTGRQAEAVAAWEEAARTDAAGVIGALRILGDHHLRAGDLDRAEHFMRQVVTHKPQSQLGWNALAQLYAARRARGEAAAGRLAEALAGAGRGGEARRALDEARAAGEAVDAALEAKVAAAP